MYRNEFDLTSFLVLWVPYILFYILAYVLCSISIFKVAKRRGIRLYGLAWVPVASAWVLGSIADAHDRRCGMEHKWRKVLLWLSIITFFGILTVLLVSALLVFGSGEPTSDAIGVGMILIVGLVWIVSVLCAMGGVVCYYICIYKFYESCRPSSTVSFLLFSFMLPITFPFFVYACRNWDNGVLLGNEPEPPYIPEQSQETDE